MRLSTYSFTCRRLNSTIRPTNHSLVHPSTDSMLANLFVLLVVGLCARTIAVDVLMVDTLIGDEYTEAQNLGYNGEKQQEQSTC